MAISARQQIRHTIDAHEDLQRIIRDQLVRIKLLPDAERVLNASNSQQSNVVTAETSRLFPKVAIAKEAGDSDRQEAARTATAFLRTRPACLG